VVDKWAEVGTSVSPDLTNSNNRASSTQLGIIFCQGIKSASKQYSRDLLDSANSGNVLQRIFRLDRMRTIAIDDRGCFSVCKSVRLSVTRFTRFRCVNTAERIEVLLGVETLGTK